MCFKVNFLGLILKNKSQIMQTTSAFLLFNKELCSSFIFKGILKGILLCEGHITWLTFCKINY